MKNHVIIQLFNQLMMNAPNLARIRLTVMSTISVLLMSCNNNSNIDITIPEQIPTIVIEGYLLPDKPTEITISRNNLMDDELIFQSIWNARVQITNSIDTLNLPNIYYTNNNRNLLVNYCNETTPQTLIGDSLYLLIETRDGESLMAQTNKVGEIAIQDTHISNDQLQINCNIPNGKFSGYIRLYVQSFSKDSTYNKKTKFIDCSQTGKPNVEFTLSSSFIDHADSLRISVFHITKAYYSYQISVDNAVSAYHDPFLIPENINSNIKGGIGIFTYYTTDSCKISATNQ